MRPDQPGAPAPARRFLRALEKTASWRPARPPSIGMPAGPPHARDKQPRRRRHRRQKTKPAATGGRGTFWRRRPAGPAPDSGLTAAGRRRGGASAALLRDIGVQAASFPAPPRPIPPPALPPAAPPAVDPSPPTRPSRLRRPPLPCPLLFIA